MSWEGSIGGGIFCIIASFLLSHFFPFMSTGVWIGLALTVVVFGTWGDLTESLLKRRLGIKDSGNILPGHGGMLDRFDSANLAIPAAVVYLYVIAVFLLRQIQRIKARYILASERIRENICFFFPVHRINQYLYSFQFTVFR